MTNDRRSSSCDPGPGRTLLTIGQDFFSIQDYVLRQYNASLHRNHSTTTPVTSFYPAATMVYSDIQTLRGVDIPVDYGSGVEYAHGLAQAFPESGIQMGLWLNGTEGCQDILDGQWDDHIHHLLDSIASWKVPKVFLRVGYEFDNPYFGYSVAPSLYAKAFRYIVRHCEAQLGYELCHDLVAFCWHSWAAPRWVDSFDEFYPGDEYVDWVGISIFQQLYPWATSSSESGDFAGGSREYVQQVLEFAKQHGNKPVMIAESTPFGGMFWNGVDFGEDDSVSIRPTVNGTSPFIMPREIWSLWFAPTLELIEEYDIRMWSYINCDWNAQPMWRSVGFGDTRLASSSTVMTNWWNHVLQNPRFVMAPLTCHYNEDGPLREHTQPTSTLLAWVAPMAMVPKWSTNELITIIWPKVLLFIFVAGAAFLLRYRYNGGGWSGCSRVGAPVEVTQHGAASTKQQEEQGYGSIIGS